MNDDGFFSEAWIKYYPTSLAIAVPNNCNQESTPVSINDADPIMKNIVNNKALRIGIHTKTAGYPAIYSLISDDNATSTERSGSNNNNSSSSTTAKYLVTENMTTTTNLHVDTLDGYEIYCAKEATKRLSDIYTTDIQSEFILISGESIFDDLVANVNNETIDIFWSTIIPSHYRDDVVNFVCNTFMTEWVIGASSNVGSTPPDFSNTTQSQIPVACFGLPCTMKVPYPFILEKLNTTNIYAPLVALGNESDKYEYNLVSFDNLDRYIDEQCQDCVQVRMDKINTTFRAPGTKFYVKNTSTSSTSNADNRSNNYSIFGMMIGCFSSVMMIMLLSF